MTNKVRLPWFRVHIVVLNDPGRLISVHLMHTGLLAGWAGLMSLYELIITDPTDPIFNPIWRQSDYVIPQMAKLGVVNSNYGWSLLDYGAFSPQPSFWTFELVAISHILFSGLLILAAFWHWAYWDLALFTSLSTMTRSIDLNKVFGIHLTLAALGCFGFGFIHLSGPGMWASDESAIAGTIRSIAPNYSILALNPFSFGTIVSHHIIAGLFGIGVGAWHISTRPGPFIYKTVRMNSIESVLSSSIIAILWVAIITSSASWYGSVTQPVELNGPTRYHWDNAFFNQDIESKVQVSQDEGKSLALAYDEVPDKLFVYDYLGSNPAKGGLFRAGPIIKGDGIIENWIGQPTFQLGSIDLQVRRAPSFFETFPVLLVDKGGSLRADIAFRRSQSRYSIEQTGVTCNIYGGAFSGSELNRAPLVKNYARKAQFGSIFSFDRKTVRSDGVFRTSIRGWYTFSHATFAIFFLLGHLWHAARAFFKEIWTGVSFNNVETIEYGYNEKLGDDSTITSNFGNI